MPVVSIPKRIRPDNPLYKEYLNTISGSDNTAETNSLLPGRIFYTPGSEDNPSTIAHEKLHIGQQRVNNPTLSSIIRQFATAIPTGLQAPTINKLSKYNWRKQADELPAYLFENDNPKVPYMQKLFNLYIDSIYRLNPQISYNLEALAPPNLMREYVTNSPRPMLPPQIQMQPMSLLDVWKRRNQ